MPIEIAMILLEKDVALSPNAVTADFRARWPDQPDPGGPESSENTLSFAVGSSNIVLGHMPAPIPWSELEGPCATSLLWPEAEDALRHHAAHVIVALQTEETDAVTRSALLTRATASALAACPEALGVYWGNATLLVPKAMFIDFAVEVLPEGPPLHIWVDFRVGKNERGETTGFTTGMRALGHMEFETENASESPGELRDRLMGLVDYLLQNGPVIKDGDTVGTSANERIQVVYTDSAFGYEEKVMTLDYDAQPVKKPWWKFGR